MSAQENVTLGVTFSPAHKIGGHPELKKILTNSQTSVSDTTSYGGGFDLSLPNTFGVGVMWSHNDKLKLGADLFIAAVGKTCSFPRSKPFQALQPLHFATISLVTGIKLHSEESIAHQHLVANSSIAFIIEQVFLTPLLI